MKNIFLILSLVLVFCGCGEREGISEYAEQKEQIQILEDEIIAQPSHPLVEAAREQIGKVIKYDTSYYMGGYPPSDRGACTDLVERALFVNDYNLKEKIDVDMNKFPSDYLHSSDPNINFRRVQNVRVFLDKYAQNLPVKVNAETLNTWKPGDIVTYNQIPGSLWHIAIVSDKESRDGIPLLIHNYGKGVVEDDFLIDWPASISGHFRLESVNL